MKSLFIESQIRFNTHITSTLHRCDAHREIKSFMASKRKKSEFFALDDAPRKQVLDQLDQWREMHGEVVRPLDRSL